MSGLGRTQQKAIGNVRHRTGRFEGALEAFDARGITKASIQMLNRKSLEKARRKRELEGSQRVIDIRKKGAANPILRVERIPGERRRINEERRRRINESIPPIMRATIPEKDFSKRTPGDEPGKPNMSIWSDITSGIGSGLSKGLSQGIQAKLAPQQKIIGPIAATIPRVLPAIGRVLTGRAATGVAIGATAASFLGGGAAGACPSGFHLAKDGSGRCVRNRRMNFGNARAARRSVRRLKGARKLLRDIEKMMPTRTTKRLAPAHHHHPAAGG